MTTPEQATSRFTDNPFRDPNLPPDKVAYLDKRNAALRHWRETGDPGPAQEFGFNLPDRRTESRMSKALNETKGLMQP